MKTFRTFCVRKLSCLVLILCCLNAGAQLHADFSSSIQQGCSPLVIQFSDLSTGNPTSWLWDLGNNVISTEKNPSAIYIAPGNYTIKLQIKNAAGEDSISKINYITVYEDPTVDFSAQPVSGCLPLNVQFNDKSIGGSGIINSWIWDFGDGIISTEENPLHTYTISDTFGVTLTATNNFGCKKTLQQPSLIKVGGLITAGFTYTYSNICNPPVQVVFTNTSQSDSKLNYQWFFGDGAVSADKSPTHTYTTSGSFTVKLVVTNGNGCTETHEETLSIGAAKADFTFTDACINQPVVFTDNSVPKSLTRTWNFGDGTTDTAATVNHVYANAGTFQVTLTAGFGGCSDVIRKTIKTGEKPVTGFSASGNTSTCIYPATVQFANTTTGATSFEWLFGDGTTSTEINPQHTYNTAGKYTVTLIAFNSNGCPDTLIKNDFIVLGPPKIDNISGLPYEGCAPKTLKLTPVITSGAAVVSYLWDFGDGTTSTDSIPKHKFINTGVYTVSLSIITSEGCTDTLVLPNAVALGKAPKPYFHAEPLNVCAQTAVEFTDSTVGLATEYLWLFGDGGSSTEKNPTHLYTDTGYKTVSLIVSQYSCYDTLTIDNYVYVKPPIANFLTEVKCSDPFTYNFIDTSIGAKTWSWNFGDNTTSTNKNEKHTYTSKGIFYVTLTVTNDECSYTKQDSINVVQENPSFNYQSLSSNFCKYDSIRFSASKYDSINIRSFQWDFGDGIFSDASVKNNEAYHLYTTSGKYLPLLIVKDINNCIDTINNNVQVTIFGPDAAFSNAAGACLNSTINFTDESTTDGTHAITKWIWNYGDSTIADTLSGGQFKHTYLKKGLFDVELKVLDNNGCYDTVTNVASIDITKPVAAFTTADTLTCSGSLVQFIDSSNGVSMEYKWDFGDGNNSNKPEPLYHYASEGVYNVRLSLKDKYGCTDTAFKPQYVRVADPVAKFVLADSLFLCPPAKINPGNTSLNYTFLTWDFGDGNTSNEIAPEHYYTYPGNFKLQLIAKGYGNCYDTLSKPFVLKGPYAQLSYDPFTGCNPLNISFSAKAKNTVQFIWDFGDGVTVVSKDSSASYKYTKPGKYIPQLIVIDSGGCHVPIVNTDTVVVFGVDAKFSAIKKQGVCDSSLYNFIDSSTTLFDDIATYEWKFGDNDSSAVINPDHYYNTPATYTTSLDIVTQKGCVANYTLPINVSIDTTPQINASVPVNACANTTVALMANTLNNSTGNLIWNWNFGDGSNAFVKDTLHAFTTANTYDVFVTATSIAGCADTVKKQIRIDPVPALNAGLDSVICKGQSITLHANGADNYSWIQDASLSCNNCASPVAKPLFNTTYYLSGSNTFGCTASDSLVVQVKQPANVLINAPDTICVGTPIQLKASGAELFSWKPASLVTNATDSITSSSPASTTLFSVIGKDSKNCFSDTASKIVNVFPYPTLQLTDSVVTVSAGSDYKINLQSSADVILWQWWPFAGLSCTNCAQPVVKPMANQTYTVTASNIAKCSDEKHITITVLCKDQNLFIPNTFSPNADGMNDYFYPRGKGLFTIKSFKIFNRWGNMIFEKNNFPPNQQTYGWDGKYNGKVLQPDVYVFVVDVVCENGTVLTSKGNITLLR